MLRNDLTESDLRIAIKIRDYNFVNQYVKQDSFNAESLNKTEREVDGGDTCLHLAIRNPEIDILRLLLQSGADPTIRNNARETPIRLAGHLKVWECVKVIAKTTVTTKDDKANYGAALFSAVAANEVETARLLINANAPVTRVSIGNNDSLLHVSVRHYNDKRMVELLLNNSADLKQQNIDRVTPIHLAATLSRWDRVIQIAKSRDTDEADAAQYNDALCLAVTANKLEAVRTLIQAKAKVPKTKFSGTGDTCLHQAIRIHQSKEMIALLLANGADLSAKNEDGDTAIHLAAKLKHWDYVELIASTKRASAGDAEQYGATLYHAVTGNNLKTASVLLKANASMHWKSSREKNGLLHIAIFPHRNLKMIRTLILHGANLAATNAAGKTPIQVAAELKYWDCVNVIARTIPASPSDQAVFATIFTAAIEDNQFFTVELLLRAKIPINWATLNDDVGLELAIISDNIEKIKFYLDKGVDFSKRNKAGMTPFQMAANRNFWVCVNVIAEHRVTLLADQATCQYLIGRCMEYAKTNPNAVDIDRIYKIYGVILSLQITMETNAVTPDFAFQVTVEQSCRALPPSSTRNAVLKKYEDACNARNKHYSEQAFVGSTERNINLSALIAAAKANRFGAALELGRLYTIEAKRLIEAIELNPDDHAEYLAQLMQLVACYKTYPDIMHLYAAFQAKNIGRLRVELYANKDADLFAIGKIVYALFKEMNSYEIDPKMNNARTVALNCVTKVFDKFSKRALAGSKVHETELERYAAESPHAQFQLGLLYSQRSNSFFKNWEYAAAVCFQKAMTAIPDARARYGLSLYKSGSTAQDKPAGLQLLHQSLTDESEEGLIILKSIADATDEEEKWRNLANIYLGLRLLAPGNLENFYDNKYWKNAGKNMAYFTEHALTLSKSDAIPIAKRVALIQAAYSRCNDENECVKLRQCLNSLLSALHTGTNKDKQFCEAHPYLSDNELSLFARRSALELSIDINWRTTWLILAEARAATTHSSAISMALASIKDEVKHTVRTALGVIHKDNTPTVKMKTLSERLADADPNGQLRDDDCCPVSLTFMDDPWIGNDGHTYDKKSLDKLIAANAPSPLRVQDDNGEVIIMRSGMPNPLKKSQLESYVKSKEEAKKKRALSSADTSTSSNSTSTSASAIAETSNCCTSASVIPVSMFSQPRPPADAPPPLQAAVITPDASESSKTFSAYANDITSASVIPVSVFPPAPSGGPKVQQDQAETNLLATESGSEEITYLPDVPNKGITLEDAQAKANKQSSVPARAQQQCSSSM